MRNTRRYGVTSFSNGYTKSELTRLKKAERVEAIVNWFYAHFEDPANRTPYESREGGYQWIWGGPYDATEEINGEFDGVVHFDLIEEAIEEVQSDGLFDWAPVSRREDYEDEESEDFLSDTLRFPSSVIESKAEAREVLLRRLSDLERLILPILAEPTRLQTTPGLGHNNPPSGFDNEEAISYEDLVELQTAVEHVKLEAGESEPDHKVVEKSQVTYVRILKSIGSWIRDRTNAAIDNANAVVITLLVTKWESVAAALSNLVEAVLNWLNSFPMPF